MNRKPPRPKKNNHYIARLLLNRFASRVKRKGKKKKCWIWQVGKDKIPVEVNTKKTAFSKYFYGKPETGVEDAFEKVETRFSYILRALDGGDQPDDYHQELNHILWLFYTRTRALRENLGDSIEEVLGLIPDLANTDQFQDQAVKQVKHELLQRIPQEKRAHFFRMKSNPAAQEQLSRMISQQLVVLTAFLPGILEDNIKKNNVIPKITKDTHIKALSEMMKEEKAPSKFTPTKWELLESKSQSFILGDSCMFAVTHDRTVSSILRAGKDWRAIYFPISSSQVLVAFRERKIPLMSIEDINQASAEVSYSHIYGSKDDTLMKFSKFTGTMASLFTPEDAAILKAKKLQALNN